MNINECYFIPDKKTSSATTCLNCGCEKMFHTIGEGIGVQSKKLSIILPVFVDTIDSNLEEGKIYISDKYKCAIHLCACGCGQKTVTPLGKDEWILSVVDNKITLRPSIGNFNGETPYHAHYYITDNKIQWL